MLGSLESSSTWYIIDLVVTNLSILGSLLMSYFCVRLLRDSPSVHVKIVLFIAIADFLFSVANIISNFEQGNEIGPLCTSEAVIRQIGFYMTIYFSAVGGVFASKISKLPTDECKNSFFKKALGYGFVICLLPLLGPIVAPKYVAIMKGPLSCVIAYTPSDTRLMKLVFLIIYEGFPVVTGTILTLGAYWHVIKEIKSLPKDLISHFHIKVYSLLWYPAVLFGSFLPCMIASFYTITRPDGESVPSWIIGMHIVLPHSIGFTNAIVYGIQRKLYSKSFTRDERKSDSTDYTSRREEDDKDEKELMKELLRAERLANQDSITLVN